jgi:uncharacterized membrane protein
MDTLATGLVLFAALGSGMMGGFFYTFSGLVMPSFDLQPVPAAIAAMQTINRVVLNPLFFLLFFDSAALSLALLALAIAGAVPALAAVGGIVYLAGVIGVTVAANVPMNNSLAAVVPASGEGERVWAEYLRRWTVWNHVRAASGALALALFAASLVYPFSRLTVRLMR